MKAVALLSGGLDSTLAVKLMLEQGIDVVAVKFSSSMCLCDQKGRCHAAETAKKFNIPFKMMAKGEDYLKVVRKPKYGYGSGMNPCIDCRIFMMKKTKKYAKEIGAKFIFTGEVLGQRPMSQHMKKFRIIERESGMEGKILRPLSAKLLPETEAEKKGWVDRSKLLAIQGRSRKSQIELAERFGIAEYSCPSGGCLLTYKEFAGKVRDLFDNKKVISWNDMNLLKIGRHFRFGGNKIVVGRNKIENKQILPLKQKSDYLFEVPGCGSPITILQGKKSKAAIETAASITAAYSDSVSDEVLVKYGREKPTKKLIVSPLKRSEIEILRIVS